MSESNRSRSLGKKQFGDGKGSRRNKRQPRRGGPGILLTCETGRESKCKREGLEILRHYYYQSLATKTEETKEKKDLSLDEEIAMLNSGATTEQVLQEDAHQTRNKPSPFSVYDTGCRGTIFAMCTLPNCSLIPPIQKEKNDSEDDAGVKRSADQWEAERAPSKRVRLDDEKAELTTETSKEDETDICCDVNNDVDDLSKGKKSSGEDVPWDPVDMVERVIKDLDSSSTVAPSSRFVTRMIPIQATCFASVEEIRQTAQELVKKCLRPIPEVHTYCISVKRRNCSNVTRDEIIQTIVEIMDQEPKADDTSAWKVDLNHGLYTIHVEICRTLCGISIVKNWESFRNFNLVQIRESRSSEKG